jgi:hypothetical protein
MMRKYTKADEPAQILSPDAHKRAEKALHKQGHTSAHTLSDKEREEFADELRQAE